MHRICTEYVQNIHTYAQYAQYAQNMHKDALYAQKMHRYAQSAICTNTFIRKYLFTCEFVLMDHLISDHFLFFTLISRCHFNVHGVQHLR